MRPALAIALGLTLSTAAFGVEGAPSDQILADMGIHNLHVMTDAEGLGVRGAGYQPKTDDLLKTIRALEVRVNAFSKDVEALAKSDDIKRDVLKFHKYADDVRNIAKKYRDSAHPPKDPPKPPKDKPWVVHMPRMQTPTMPHGPKGY